MNLLMVAPEQIPVPGSGSVEISMLAIARQLALNHTVTLISRTGRGLPHVSRMGRLTIIRVNTGSPSRYIASVLRYIRGRRYDLIQVDNRPHYMAKIKALFPHTPVTLFLHSLTFVKSTARVNESLGKADLIIVNSDSLKASLAARFPRHAGKLRKVHLGVDTGRFRPAEGRANRSGGRFRVLFAGRVIPRKGVPVLIRAVGLARQEYEAIDLTVIGGGRPGYIKELKRLARARGVPVKFTGKVPHRAIHRKFREADLFACPSQEHEAFGLVNVEAMASGLPVVASNIGGIGEIIKHGANGYLVDAYAKPADHAKWILKLARDRELAAKLSRQARKDAVERFSWKQTAGKLMGIYKQFGS
ncbi:glycosyltransferase family 4 protein [Paenibacillus timonensis]|uniref:glycosyltransferase family 4 protein n=1 Tax=Paenibacillus timonensis TaxID=225915 RepID=UPI003F946396